MRRLLSSFAFTVTLLCPWIALAQAPPANCSVTSQNLWVRDQLTNFYYWYQFLPANINPASYSSPEAYLQAVRYRPIDNSYSYITSAAANDAFYSDSQFIGFGFSTQTTSTDLRVLQVFDASPALDAGLERGDLITQVNGQNVLNLISAGTIGAVFGASEIGVASDVVFEKPSGERRQARMVKRLVTIPTVSLTRVVEVDGRKVGYLFFRNFVRPSEAALNEAFLALRAAAPAPKAVRVQGQGETILVVEDNTSLRLALVEILKTLNYRTLEAVNGREALAILEQQAGEIDLVLSDLVMPEMGGQALLQAMRARGSTLPLVVLSGHPLTNEMQAMQELGLAGWLLKPPGIEELAALLARALGQEGDADFHDPN